MTGTSNSGLILETTFSGQSSGTTRGGMLTMQRDATSTLTALSTNFQFLTTNEGSLTEKVRIDPDGKVGIGTTTPTTALDVAGVITATGGSSANWNQAYAWGNHATMGYLTSGTVFTLSGDVTGTGTGGGLLLLRSVLAQLLPLKF